MAGSNIRLGNQTFLDDDTYYLDSGGSGGNVRLLVNDGTSTAIDITFPESSGTLLTSSSTVSNPLTSDLNTGNNYEITFDAGTSTGIRNTDNDLYINLSDSDDTVTILNTFGTNSDCIALRAAAGGVTVNSETLFRVNNKYQFDLSATTAGTSLTGSLSITDNGTPFSYSVVTTATKRDTVDGDNTAFVRATSAFQLTSGGVLSQVMNQMTESSNGVSDLDGTGISYDVDTGNTEIDITVARRSDNTSTKWTGIVEVITDDTGVTLGTFA